MNSEQLQDFLCDLVEASLKVEQRQASQSQSKTDESAAVRKFLTKTSGNTLYCMQYVNSNYTDVDLVQPVVAQILALYYKGGLLRQYVLQYVPAFVGTYLFALSKKQHKSASIFETFFLAIYNEEILACGPGSDGVAKKVEEIRIPSVRYRSIYHDPSKINSLPEIVTMKPGGAPGIQTAVRIGPFASLERFTTENKFLILTRILNAVNANLCAASEAVSRYMCLSTMSICHSGFSFAESKLRSRVLGTEIYQEVLDDYSKKPRQHVSAGLLLELLTGCYLALCNASPDLALRAIDVIHQRAQYEMFAEVLLVTNSIRNFLLENPLSKERREELMWKQQRAKDRYKKDCVTNASLRIRKMPEDIPVQPELHHKEPSRVEEFIDDIAEGVDHLKKKMSQLSHHHKKKHNAHQQHQNNLNGSAHVMHQNHQNPKIGNGNKKEAVERRYGIEAVELELATIQEDGQSESTPQSAGTIDRPTSIDGETRAAGELLYEGTHLTIPVGYQPQESQQISQETNQQQQQTATNNEATVSTVTTTSSPGAYDYPQRHDVTHIVIKEEETPLARRRLPTPTRVASETSSDNDSARDSDASHSSSTECEGVPPRRRKHNSVKKSARERNSRTDVSYRL